MNLRPSYIIIPLFILILMFQPERLFGADNSGSEFRKFKDDFGNEGIIKQEPSRIVSLAPNITEMLFLIGKGNRLVGVTNFCDYPPAAKKIEKVGGISDFNIEKIVSLKPDVVIGLAQGRVKTLVAKLKETGLNVYILSIKNIDDIVRGVKDLSKLTGAELSGNKEWKRLLSEYDNFANKSGAINRTAIDSGSINTLFIVSDSPPFIATDKSIEGEIIIKSGGAVPKSLSGESYTLIGKEKVMEFKPLLIIIADGNHSGHSSNPIISMDIPAVKNKMIFPIDESLVLRPGPRIFLGMQKIEEAFMKARSYYKTK